MDIINNTAVRIRTRNVDRFSIIPKHVAQPIPGGHEVLVYWGLDEMRVLKNMGFKVPSPIERKYEWPGRYKPMAHQKATAGFLTLHRRAFCFNDPGTAKTMSALWAADYLMKRGEVRRCLIVCPLSIMHSAWLGDITNSVIHRSAVIAHHAQAIRRIEMIQGDYEFVIINYDGLNLVANEIANDGRFDLVIVDECFVAGTQIATPERQRPIESLQEGDEVLTTTGAARIKRVVCNTSTNLVTVRTSDGKETTCTADHPFFTDAGWVTAKHLTGRRLVRAHELPDVPNGLSTREVQTNVATLKGHARWDDLLTILRTEAVPRTESGGKPLQPHVAGRTWKSLWDCTLGRIQSKHVTAVESEETLSESARRERCWNDISGALSERLFAYGVGMELPNSVGREAQRLSHLLQAGLCESVDYAGVGGRRELPQYVCPETAGQEEGSETSYVRVVSVTHHEQGSAVPVYNLEVEGTPHYFANGNLVHNCNAYATPTTRRWKSLSKIITPRTFLWMMTGTPAAQSPVNAYGLAKLVNPAGVPGYFTSWRDRVMMKISQFKWVPKPEAKTLVFNALQPAIRFTKEQCLDLPPVLKTTREVPMTAQQAKYYKKIKDDMLVIAAGQTISAVNKAAVVNKLLQVSCIAYNMPVLTDAGWVPIQDVRLAHRVWDGVEFVHHEGLLARDTKPVVELDGVWLTDDHFVMTASGWHTVKEIHNGGQSIEFNRPEVRLPDGAGTCRCVAREDNESTLAVSLRVRGGSRTGEPVPALEAQEYTPPLRLPAPEQNARHVEIAPLQHLGKNEEPLPAHRGQRLVQLRRAWNKSVSRVGGVFRRVLERHAVRVRPCADVGAPQREQGVQQKELHVGDPNGTRQQHPLQPGVGNTVGDYDGYASCTRVRTEESNTVRAPESRLADGSGVVVTYARTFDIHNCGPRNRFVVRGADGRLLIVHNCGGVYSEDGDVVEFDATPRMNLLLEILEETDRKVIIFAMFRSIIDIIHTFLNKHGHNTEIIDGRVAASKRGDIISRFQFKPDLRVLVMQPQATAHGITLTAADTVVFFGPLMSVELYTQCIARADRKGQTAEKVTVIHIQSSPIEEKMFKAMDARVNDHALLTQMFDEEMEV